MKNKTKILMATLSLAVLSSTAVAEEDKFEFSYFDKERPAHEFLSLSVSERTSFIEQSEKLDNIGLLASLQEYVVTTNNHKYKESEESVLLAFTSAFPEFKGYWDNETNYKGTYVLQKDSLIDLESVNYFDKPTRINKDALKYGISPVGEDGKKIQVCLLTQNKASSWFEVSQKDIPVFEKALYGNTNFELLCIGEKHLSQYWKERLNDFSEYNYDYTERYHYDRSE